MVRRGNDYLCNDETGPSIGFRAAGSLAFVKTQSLVALIDSRARVGWPAIIAQPGGWHFAIVGGAARALLRAAIDHRPRDYVLVVRLLAKWDVVGRVGKVARRQETRRSLWYASEFLTSASVSLIGRQKVAPALPLASNCVGLLARLQPAIQSFYLAACRPRPT